MIQAVARGQWEGAEALALSWPQTMRLVIVPQAIRSAIPPTIGFSVQVVKNTALASIIGFIELTRAGQIVASATFQPLQVYLTVGRHLFRHLLGSVLPEPCRRSPRECKRRVKAA